MKIAGAAIPLQAQVAVPVATTHAQLVVVRSVMLLAAGVAATTATAEGGRDVAPSRDMPPRRADGVTPHLYPHPMTSDRE